MTSGFMNGRIVTLPSFLPSSSATCYEGMTGCQRGGKTERSHKSFVLAERERPKSSFSWQIATQKGLLFSREF
jgi:predicted secreted protein